MNLNFYFILFA